MDELVMKPTYLSLYKYVETPNQRRGLFLSWTKGDERIYLNLPYWMYCSVHNKVWISHQDDIS